MQDNNSSQNQQPKPTGPSINTTAIKIAAQKTKVGQRLTATVKSSRLGASVAGKAVGRAIGAVAGGPIGTAIAIASLVNIKKLPEYVGGVVAGMGTGIGGMFAAAGAVISAALTGVGVTLAIAILTIPILVGLIMFIINSGAYIVPPTGSSGGGYGGTDFESSIGNASCLIEGGYVLNGSYDPREETSGRGHGTNWYWNRFGGACSFPMPQTALECYGPTVETGPNNRCNHARSTCPYYGRAADIFPPADGSAINVYAPSINGESLAWNYKRTFNNTVGVSHIYTDSTGRYTLVLTHTKVNKNTTLNIPSGTKLTELFYEPGNTHLHLEFQVEGVWQRPEDWFCK